MLNSDLRKLRLSLDVTQREMAEKLGVSRQMYGLYERGNAPISKTIELLAETIREKLGQA